LRVNKFEVTIKKFQQFVTDEILPDLGIENKISISDSSVRRWLIQMGFIYKKYKKDIYYDGHEREDVVNYRKEFLQKMNDLEPLMPEFSDDLSIQINPTLENGQKLHIVVTHDESTFYANDGRQKMWLPEYEQPLIPKGLGGSIMVSDYLCETIGRLKLDDARMQINSDLPPDQQIPKEACVIIHPGANNEGYWDCDKMSKQLKEKAIPIFEAMHPGCVAVFAFDNSTNHRAYASDALLVSRMNLNPGGGQPKMRTTTMRDDTIQEMVFEDGTPKGMKVILEERKLWKEGLRKICSDCKNNNDIQQRSDCCASRILSLEPDFASQKSLLSEIIENAGHKAIFYPKFHCELNFIEMFWGAAKQYTRKNCDYSFKSLKKIVPEALESVPLLKIRKFARKSRRYMSAYRIGLTGKQALFAVNKYKSHRRVPVSVINELGNINI
jgi:hypothetical protein